MSEIFISHAVADQVLADTFVTFLKEAIGVPAKDIFCSSVDGQGIPLGDDFNEYMKSQIQNPKLVILLMTPRYMESWFCLMELGATWAKSHKALPIVVPPVKFNTISNTLGLKQGWSIDNDAKLIDLRKMITTTDIKLEDRIEHDWDKKRTVWKADLRKLLRTLAPATNVPASEHQEVQEELLSARRELAELQDAYGEATTTIDELKAAKDPAAVKAIMAKKTDFNAEAYFNDLVEKIADLRQPQISKSFYRNLIMDNYDKAAAINWYDNDQKLDGEKAIQYNIMENESPYAYRWASTKLKKLSAALRELGEFITSPEARDFVKGQERDGISMEVEDLEFWDYHLS